MAKKRPAEPDALTHLHYEMAAHAAMWRQSRAIYDELPQRAVQRKITTASLELVRPHRSDFQVFDDILIQYQKPGTQDIWSVNSDDMVVLCDKDLGPLGSYDVPHQPARPFWVMRTLTNSGKRKGIDEAFQKYERDLAVPYYLTFSPDEGSPTLYHLNGESHRYETVPPDGEGRCAVPEVNISVGVMGGWVRFWFEGRLLMLPTELDRELGREKRRADDAISRGERLAAQLRAMGVDPAA